MLIYRFLQKPPAFPCGFLISLMILVIMSISKTKYFTLFTWKSIRTRRLPFVSQQETGQLSVNAVIHVRNLILIFTRNELDAYCLTRMHTLYTISLLYIHGMQTSSLVEELLYCLIMVYVFVNV